MPPTTPTLASLPDYIRGLAALGRRTALIEQRLYRGTAFTYAELIGKALACQRELRRRGIRPGDRVMLWGASGAAWAIVFYACVIEGIVVVPFDAAFSAAFAQRVGQQTEAVLLCTDHSEALPGIPTLRFDEIAALPPEPSPLPPPPPPSDDTLLEIVYTSGATADPKGVMITHGNLLANLRPIAREVAKYKPKARLLLPLRFLHLIPLSHLFGQVMGLLIPPLVDSAVIYPESQAPAQWAALIRRHRASVLVAVPQQLSLFSQWAADTLGMGIEAIANSGEGRGVLWRWWRWRRLHRRLGWKMWAFVVGGAALPSSLEEFWNRLGFAVLQGYGLTETAPAIAITHPFKIRRGAVGRMLAGVETKLGPDGEILVRGENVSPGYYRNPEATQETFADGWLHTGDLGRVDAEGNLHFLGRKKEVIVTSDGLNVYPEDVERALAAQPAIAECAVVEQRRGDSAQVRAVAVLRPTPAAEAPARLEAAVAAANATLEPHQRIRAASLWPLPQLPRTASTRKLQRVAITRWVNHQASAAPSTGTAVTTWREFAQQRWGIAPERWQPQARLDADLGLSSLDRVELWSWIETHGGGALDEAGLALANTVADVDALILPPNAAAPPAASPHPLLPAAARVLQNPQWPLRPALRHFRAAAYPALVFPALHLAVSRIEIEGRDALLQLRRPVLFVANHQSLLDVPVVARALPPSWRPWLASAMGLDPVADALDPHASLRRRWRAARRFALLRAFFNAYLLSDRGAVSASLRRTGELVDRGFCPLIFPEGRRTPDGAVHAFRPGIGVFAAALRIPVVPVRIEGLFEILPATARLPHRGPVRVRFGTALHFDGEDAEQVTAALQAWFRISA